MRGNNELCNIDSSNIIDEEEIEINIELKVNI